MDFAPIARFGLLLIRPGMLVMVSPVLGGKAAPAPVKIGLTILLAIGLTPMAAPALPAGELTLSVIVAREVAIGLALAFVVQALVAGAEFAGHLAGQQIGFSYGATIDPASGVRNTMIASLYGMLTLLAFFGINGHHAVLRTLAASYQGLPIGAGHVNESLVEAVRTTLGLVFTLGLRLAAPVIVVLLLVETVVGLISRTAPALNFMVVGYAIRVIVGLLVVAASIGLIPGLVGSLVDTLVSLSLRAAAAFR
jgi:flagellar biosynthetic protein FliR